MRICCFVLALAAACSSPPEAAQPGELTFAVEYLKGQPDTPTVDEPPALEASPERATKSGPQDETRGLLEVSPERLAELIRIADDGKALAALLMQPISRTDLEALAWIRSPAVRAARGRLEAVRTGYAQSTDLRDLAALYRSFLRETRTRVGPEKSRRATASIAPYPNVDALSGLIVDKAVAITFEDLRRTIRDLVADAERAHADAARLVGARRVVRRDVELQESLVKVLRARVESGRSTQAALLAFQSRLETLRTELGILDEQRASVRARWNHLLHRPESAALNIDVQPSAPKPDDALPTAQKVRALALTEQQALRIATLRAERQALAVRLAETMTLPRMDVGSSRFERERAGEAGVQRGQVFPEPGRMVRPRWDFGVREAQLTEMRAKARAAVGAQEAARDATQSDARIGLFALDSAQRRWRVHGAELVPLAERSFETTRGSYEGNRAGYIELLESARELLRARLGLVDSRRDYSHARARLLQAVGVRAPSERNEK